MANKEEIGRLRQQLFEEDVDRITGEKAEPGMKKMVGDFLELALGKKYGTDVWAEEARETITGEGIDPKDDISDEDFEKAMMSINEPDENMEGYRREAIIRANRHEVAELKQFNCHLPHYRYDRIKSAEIVSFEQGYEFAMKQMESAMKIAAMMNPPLDQFIEAVKGSMKI